MQIFGTLKDVSQSRQILTLVTLTYILSKFRFRYLTGSHLFGFGKMTTSNVSATFES